MPSVEADSLQLATPTGLSKLLDIWQRSQLSNLQPLICWRLLSWFNVHKLLPQQTWWWPPGIVARRKASENNGFPSHETWRQYLHPAHLEILESPENLTSGKWVLTKAGRLENCKCDNDLSFLVSLSIIILALLNQGIFVGVRMVTGIRIKSLSTLLPTEYKP